MPRRAITLLSRTVIRVAKDGVVGSNRVLNRAPILGCQGDNTDDSGDTGDKPDNGGSHGRSRGAARQRLIRKWHVNPLNISNVATILYRVGLMVELPRILIFVFS